MGIGLEGISPNNMKNTLTHKRKNALTQKHTNTLTRSTGRKASRLAGMAEQEWTTSYTMPQVSQAISSIFFSIF